MSTQDAERLKAGLDEDERAAKVAPAVFDSAWLHTDWAGEGTRAMDYYEQFPPARALADIAAKRAILDRLERATRYRDQVFAQDPPRSVSDEMRAVTTMMTLEVVVKLLATVYGAPGESGTPGHAYLSTSCLHGEHTYCQSKTGSNGTTEWAKAPASCKFCGAPCACPCHAALAASPDEPAETVT